MLTIRPFFKGNTGGQGNQKWVIIPNLVKLKCSVWKPSDPNTKPKSNIEAKGVIYLNFLKYATYLINLSTLLGW